MEEKVLFSKIAKPRIFGLGMTSKENFFAYSTQFIFLIIRLVPGNVVMVTIYMCWKNPITGEWIYGIPWNMYYHLCFLFIYLFAYLFNNVFTFHICNIWFVLANFKIYFFFFISKFMVKILSVNMPNFVNSILTFIGNNIFASRHSRVFRIIGIHIRYTWGIPVGGRLISSKITGCMSTVLVEIGSFVGVSQVFCSFYYSFCKRLFLGICL